MYEGKDTYNLFNNTLAPKLNEAIEQISHTAVRLHKSEYKLELLENYCESFDEATLPLIPYIVAAIKFCLLSSEEKIIAVAIPVFVTRRPKTARILISKGILFSQPQLIQPPLSYMVLKPQP